MGQKKEVRWALLASGKGSLCEAVYARGVPVPLFLCDRPCRALEISMRHEGTEAMLIQRGHLDRKKFDPQRPAYTAGVIHCLKSNEITHVAMAGFETILSPSMFLLENYGGRVTNNHPSLLPKFKGLNAPHQAIAAHAIASGFTIHIATSNLDDGPIIIQREVPILPEDTGESLWERIKIAERRALPEIMLDVIEGRLDLESLP